ncbi:MAG TPA: metalloregulator ArsR/SmtB family transcription factor, partial [candidate division Zixibacteria bacterium]
MEKEIYELHASICQTLSNPKRLEILNLLREKEVPVSQLIKITGLPKANLSQHLAILRQKKIVLARREGVNIYYRIANPKVIKACDLMREVLYEQLSKEQKLTRIL